MKENNILTDNQRYTIIFNQEAADKLAQQKTTNQLQGFSADDHKSFIKENWFETTLWIGGILALLVAVGTIIS